MAASRDEVYERVKEVLSEQLGVDESEINEEASFQEDLDADSLDLVELIMELEDQFGIKISDEDAQKIQTIGQAVDYVPPHQSPRSPRPPDRPAPRGAARQRLHALVLGARPRVVLRTARVPRRQRARARDRPRALRPLSGLLRGPAGQDPLPRRLSGQLCGRREGARARDAPAGSRP